MTAKDALVSGAAMGATFAIASIPVAYLIVRYILLPNLVIPIASAQRQNQSQNQTGMPKGFL